MAGTTWYNLQGGQKAKASQVMANFDWIEGNIVPMNAGAQTNTAYDIGSDSYRWRDFHLGRYLYAHDNIYLDTTKILYMNGLSAAAGGTYFQCLSSGSMNIYAQGTQTMNFVGTLVQSFQNFAVQNGKRLYFDGGGNTYITEASTTTDRISFFCNNSQLFWIEESPTEVVVNTTLRPTGSGIQSLGTSGNWWYDVHYATAVTHSITTPNTDNATRDIARLTNFGNKKDFPAEIYRPTEVNVPNSKEGLGLNKLLGYILKAIQELNDRIETLENA